MKRVKWLLIRHAPAEDREAFVKVNKNDLNRSLTSEGQMKFRKMADFLEDDLSSARKILVSPAQRCLQTAEILRPYIKEALWEESKLLLPTVSFSEELFSDLVRQSSDGLNVLVTHCPLIDEIVNWMIVEDECSTIVHFKKGSSLRVHFNYSNQLIRSSIQLRWFISCNQL